MPWFLTPVTVYIETEASNVEEARLKVETIVSKRIEECEFGHRKNDRAAVRSSMTEIGETDLDGDDEDDDGELDEE